MKHLFAFALVVAAACGGKSNPPAPGPGTGAPQAACVAGGCSSHMCIEEGSPGGISTCEYRDEYACYQSATCERQPDGQCGWTPTPELEACIANPPSQQ